MKISTLGALHDSVILSKNYSKSRYLLSELDMACDIVRSFSKCKIWNKTASSSKTKLPKNCSRYSLSRTQQKYTAYYESQQHTRKQILQSIEEKIRGIK